MLGLQYVPMALKHWKEWLPEMYKEMKAEGTLNKYAQDASKSAPKQVALLMAAGARKVEAEEIVLPDVILLPPEEEWTWPRGRGRERKRRA
jgi:hypothetical protein